MRKSIASVLPFLSRKIVLGNVFATKEKFAKKFLPRKKNSFKIFSFSENKFLRKMTYSVCTAFWIRPSGNPNCIPWNCNQKNLKLLLLPPPKRNPGSRRPIVNPCLRYYCFSAFFPRLIKGVDPKPNGPKATPFYVIRSWAVRSPIREH